MTVVENLLPEGCAARPCIERRDTKRIVIHWIGPYPKQDAAIVRNWWLKGADGKGVQASAHFVVKDRAVTCCVPIGEVAWHAGDGRNYDSVGIEVVPADTKGVFSDETVLTLRELAAYVRAYYRKQNPSVERHFDGVQKKDCPRWYTPAVEGGQERWNAMLAVLEGHGGKK